MKFSLKHIFKYLTSADYKLGRMVQVSDDKLEFKPNKHWAKIEQGGSGELQWTDYVDHEGNEYRIYDLITAPGFSGAYLNKKEDKDE